MRISDWSSDVCSSDLVASASLANTRALRDSLASLAGVEAVFSAAHFHETVIRLPQPVASVLERLAAVGIFGGFDLSVAGSEERRVGEGCVSTCSTRWWTD